MSRADDGPAKGEVTRLLAQVRGADKTALERLMPIVYDRLHAIALGFFRDRAHHTLEPTALVHEAYLRLVDKKETDWRDRAHFFALCAAIMRGILVDHARRKAAAKRGGDRRRVTLSGIEAPGGGNEVDLLALDDALTELAALSPRQASIVEYRFFAGLSMQEIARELGVSTSTVDSEWYVARAWLSRRLSTPPDGEVS